ncbi:MAG: FAD-binding protein [Deltaproteobacteria bacterium]|nr:FAD-binding protein [Deltaproteobacteria bacterium]
MMTDRIKNNLVKIVGPNNYTEKIMDLVAYSYDGSTYSGRPDCAIWVKTTDQVSQVLSLANREKTPVIPRGAGTGISGNAVPAEGGIVLDITRMNKILDVRIGDRLCVVQPGVVYNVLQAELEPHGFFFPPDPASGKVCTLGGNVATNAGGLRAAKYGATRDFVLGLQVVLASGEVMRIGANTMKTSSGYDLTRLFVGSEGTLGVFTEITLKIAPRPAARATALSTFDSVQKAAEAICQIMYSDVTPSTLEYLDTSVIEMLQKYSNTQIPPAKAILLVETDGNSRADVSEQLQRIVRLLKRCQALEVNIARSEEEAERLWQVRKSIPAMMGSTGLSFMPEDITVPMSRISDYLEKCRDISRKRGLLILNFGHAGDGNFHTNILYDPSNSSHMDQLEPARYDLHRLACELGGTLSGEHGIGMTKAGFMHLEHDAVSLGVMRRLKRVLDPNNILNPGKLGL